jgi:hypothetical protein
MLISVSIYRAVIPGLVPGIHVFHTRNKQDVDGRDEPGHDGKEEKCPKKF